MMTNIEPANMTAHPRFRLLGKALFFQMEMESGTFLMIGTLNTLADMLGVRRSFTPELLVRRVARKFGARCRFIAKATFLRKVKLAQDPNSGYVDVMHFYRPNYPAADTAG